MSESCAWRDRSGAVCPQCGSTAQRDECLNFRQPTRLVAYGLPDDLRYFKLIKEFPLDEPLVALCTCRDRVYAATSKRVYVVQNDKLKPLDIVGEEVVPPKAVTPS